jgi:hypothetical protein
MNAPKGGASDERASPLALGDLRRDPKQPALKLF